MAKIPGTVIVNFNSDLGESVIKGFLRSEKLRGTLVSSIMPRYAIEVPPGQEEDYIRKFQDCDLISQVNETCLKGRITPRKQYDNVIHKDTE